ncbi:MAG: pyridoxal-phosphate dependent enzyme, partial [Gammaproteobacteria bacterium]|nr:pyridoxal-phosphate dependent enzyme [Gammaproteobacteria bacterium]
MSVKAHPDILSTVGNTPVIRINQLAPPGINLFVKVEAFNPMGSVKDRMALNTIRVARESGDLEPGQTVIEATSGNTGIGLAMVCAVLDHPLVLTMAESFSIERRKILRFLGARVVLTPAEAKGSGMLEKAVELAQEHGWFLVRQFENEANAQAHENTTAIEILDTFPDNSLDYFVTGFGTGGTLKGTSKILRERSPATRIMVCEPDNSQLLGSGIPQSRDSNGQPLASHPNFRPHLMQGWSPDFIPKLTEDAVNAGVIDELLPIDGHEAMRMSRELARKEGIFSGTSGGATFAGALAVARKAEPGSNILCMLPDTGERYLSTPLFEDIPVEMSDEELEISRSTPGFRFDQAATAPAAAAQAAAPEIDADAVVFFEKAISDPENPIAFFALEWCEFCWSVRKLFAKLEIPYQSFDLDSAAYQQDTLGGKLRAVLLDRLGTPTIPQIFIGGVHIGGATDLFAALKEGRLEELLSTKGISMAAAEEGFE